MAANSFYMSTINIITMMKQTGQNLCVLHMCFGTENSSHKLNPQTAELAKPGLLGVQGELLQLSCVHYYIVVDISLEKTLRGLLSFSYLIICPEETKPKSNVT